MKKNLLIIAALLLVAGTLQAAMVTYSNSATMISSQNATFSLSKFDVALGTLTGVYVEYWTTLADSQFQMDNDSTSAQNATAKLRHIGLTLSQTPSLLRSDFTTISAADLSISSNRLFSLAATTTDDPLVFNNTGAGDYAVWAPGTLIKTVSGNINNFTISQYEGVGSYAVTANAEINTFVEYSGTDGRISIDTPTGAFAGKVIYTYSPIPEPATALSLLLGGLVITGYRRLRKGYGHF
jgi:hypothetical protein